MFSSELYEAAVNEDALPGTVILSISSSDADTPENARVDYYVTGARVFFKTFVNRRLRHQTSRQEVTFSYTQRKCDLVVHSRVWILQAVMRWVSSTSSRRARCT